MRSGNPGQVRGCRASHGWDGDRLGGAFNIRRRSKGRASDWILLRRKKVRIFYIYIYLYFSLYPEFWLFDFCNIIPMSTMQNHDGTIGGGVTTDAYMLGARGEIGGGRPKDKANETVKLEKYQPVMNE